MAPPPPEILPSKLGDPQPRRREEGRFPRRPHDVSDLPHLLRRRDLRLPSSHAAAAHFRRHPRLAAGPRPREHLLLPMRPGGSPRPSSAQDNDMCQSCHRLLRLCGERQPIVLVGATCSLLRSHARIFFSSSFNATPPEFEGYGHPILRHRGGKGIVLAVVRRGSASGKASVGSASGRSRICTSTASLTPATCTIGRRMRQLPSATGS